MKLNQKFIQQLRNGEIDAKNNGTLKQLRELLKAAFPEDSVIPAGSTIYYSRSTSNSDKWMASPLPHKDKPTLKISDFYQPELFTGWAKDDNHPKWMGYIKNDVAVFGFNSLGVWMKWGVNGCVYSEDPDSRPATNEEIEKRLTKEAKRRGYKKGVTCFHASENYKTTLASNDIEYFISRKGYGVLVMGGYTIFSEKDGQWAEIIEQPQPKPKKSTAINYLKEIESPLALRDYFAAKAMQGLISNPNVKRPHPENGEMPPQYGSFVRIAYEYADAMLQERNETDKMPGEIKQERDEFIKLFKSLFTNMMTDNEAWYFAEQLINRIENNE